MFVCLCVWLASNKIQVAVVLLNLAGKGSYFDSRTGRTVMASPCGVRLIVLPARALCLCLWVHSKVM